MPVNNHQRPRPDYVAKLEAMTDTELEAAADQMIWLSAYANNNSRSDYHWQCYCCYDELMRRTHTDEAYGRIHKKLMKNA